MWFLLIVLLNPVPGFAPVTILEKYHTAEECQGERDRVGFDMATAYPYERDFIIVCEYRPTKV